MLFKDGFPRTIEESWLHLRQRNCVIAFTSFTNMKADIHPNYTETTIVCACGAVYRTRSTRRDIKIGICAACHPYFTGEQKFVDTAGRVEKFARRYGKTLMGKGKSK
jgi:large subunit ribosomal protein L31